MHPRISIDSLNGYIAYPAFTLILALAWTVSGLGSGPGGESQPSTPSDARSGFVASAVAGSAIADSAVADATVASPAAHSAVADSAALIDLGRHLFFDPRLSGDGSLSCASCHRPDRAWADGEPLSEAYPGSDGFRNTKSLLNAGASGSFYWDGRLPASDPETLVRDAITETHFMNMDGRLLLERLKQIPAYVDLFDEAFGPASEPSFGGTLGAVAAFMSTLRTRNAPWDTDTMNEAARRGEQVFRGKAGCARCHSGSDFTDGLAYRTGVPVNPDVFSDPLRHLTYRSFIKAMGVPNYRRVRRDVGVYTVTKDSDDTGAFITPSLRHVADTAPYMHNGVMDSLSQVIAFYDRGGGSDELAPLELTSREAADLEAFLHALSGSPPEIERPPQPRYEPMSNWTETEN